MAQSFEATLIGRGPKQAWAFLPIPFSVAEVFGTKARLPVVGTINGVPFRSSLMPEGDGTHAMMVNQALRTRAQTGVGQRVTVVLDADTAPRRVQIPADLKSALTKDLLRRWTRLSYSHQKEYADWINSAKRPETRRRRIQDTRKRIGPPADQAGKA